jgi:hypothetical protein
MTTTHNLKKIVGGALLSCGLALSGVGMALATATPATAGSLGHGSGGGAGKVAVAVHERLITQFTHSAGGGGGAGKVTAVDQFRRFVNRFGPPPPP